MTVIPEGKADFLNEVTVAEPGHPVGSGPQRPGGPELGRRYRPIGGAHPPLVANESCGNAMC